MRGKNVCMALIMTVVLSLGWASGAYASDDGATAANTQPSDAATVLMELSTGQVLAEQNAHVTRPVSSLAKIMTVLLVSEAVSDGALSMDDKVACSDNAASMGGAQIWLKPGEEMTVEELLRATLIGNANDAAVALAEKTAGSEKAFVERMNARAKELGMSNTTFENAAGYDTGSQRSTAYDLALASRELMKHERLYAFMGTWMDDLRGGETELVNNNRLIKTYPGIMGVMAATKTDEAGFGVSACAIREGFGLVAVVLGMPSNEARFESAAALMDTGFGGYELFTPAIDSKALTPVKVKNGVQGKAGLHAENMMTLVIPKGRAADIVQELKLEEEVEAPVESGQTLGTITFLLDGKELVTTRLVAMESIPKMNVLSSFLMLLKAFLQNG